MQKKALFRSDVRGVAAVEFAFIAPILMFLIIAIFEYGMFMNMQMRLENLSRSIAQYIIQGGSIDNIWEDVVVEGNYFPDIDDLESEMGFSAEEVCECEDAVEVSCDNECDNGEYKRYFIEVDLEMNYTPMIPYPGLPDSMTMRGNTRLQTQ